MYAYTKYFLTFIFSFIYFLFSLVFAYLCASQIEEIISCNPNRSRAENQIQWIKLLKIVLSDIR